MFLNTGLTMQYAAQTGRNYFATMDIIGAVEVPKRIKKNGN